MCSGFDGLQMGLTMTSRLRRQHENDVRVFGNRLITAPVQLKAGDRILDSGAGGGGCFFPRHICEAELKVG